jgi:hypothetical protein
MTEIRGPRCGAGAGAGSCRNASVLTSSASARASMLNHPGSHFPNSH